MNIYSICSRNYFYAWVLLFSGLLSLNAQTVRIDTVAPINTINPRDSVGAGVDRIPVEAIDHDLTKQALAPVLQSGWQPVEPVVRVHSEKELLLLHSENSGANAG